MRLSFGPSPSWLGLRWFVAKYEAQDAGDGAGDDAGSEDAGTEDGGGATAALPDASHMALMVRLTNGNTHTFHQSVFAAAYLVDTGGRDLARANTEFDDGALRVTWDEGDHGVFPSITEAAEATEAPVAAEAGPAMQALLAAMAAAHESDRAAKRHRRR